MKHFHLPSYIVGLCSGLVVLLLFFGIAKFTKGSDRFSHDRGRTEWQGQQRDHNGSGFNPEMRGGRMAEQLGMSEEELQEELSKGKTFWEIAEEKDVDIASFGRGQRPRDGEQQYQRTSTGEMIAPFSEEDIENRNGAVPPEEESPVSNEDEGKQPSTE